MNKWKRGKKYLPLALFTVSLFFALAATTQFSYGRYHTALSGATGVTVAVQRMKVAITAPEQKDGGEYVIPLVVSNCDDKTGALSETDFAYKIIVNLSQPLDEEISFSLQDKDAKPVPGTLSSDRKTFTTASIESGFKAGSLESRTYRIVMAPTAPNRIKDYTTELSATVIAEQID